MNFRQHTSTQNRLLLQFVVAAATAGEITGTAEFLFVDASDVVNCLAVAALAPLFSVGAGHTRMLTRHKGWRGERGAV